MSMLLLDTDQVPVAERIEAFGAVMLGTCVPMTIVHEDPARPIRARMQLWRFGDVHLFASDNTGFRLTRSRRQLSLEGTPYVALNLQLRGASSFEQFGHRRRVPPGALMLNDLSAVYDVGWSGAGGSQSLHVGYDRLGLPHDVIRRAGPNLRPSPLHDLVRDHLTYLRAQGTRRREDADSAALGNATVDLLRALIVSAAGDEILARPVRDDTMLTRILSYTRWHLTEPDLTPGRIAAAHNISLRHLYLIFRRADLSLEQWIITQRLDGACADLTSPTGRRHTIAAVARSWGFTQPSHFTRRFQAAYGITPRDWQRTHLT
jgi:AraC-like DNA-binding protein